MLCWHLPAVKYSFKLVEYFIEADLGGSCSNTQQTVAILHSFNYYYSTRTSLAVYLQINAVRHLCSVQSVTLRATQWNLPNRECIKYLSIIIRDIPLNKTSLTRDKWNEFYNYKVEGSIIIVTCIATKRSLHTHKVDWRILARAQGTASCRVPEGW